VFLLATAAALWLNGNRFVLTADEGILLVPAQQIAQGMRPYVDFFGYMTPGSYWIQAALFKLFGFALWVGRLPVIFDFAAQCAIVFYLTSRLAHRRAAIAASLAFLGFQIADPTFLTAQHRWDSTTLALIGVCFALQPSFRVRTSPGTPLWTQLTLNWSWTTAVAGILLGFAAWCTPSIALTGIAVAVWLMISPDRRPALLPFGFGIALVCVVAVAALALQGTLGAFIDQLRWLQKNYSSVNVMPYGSVIGGWKRLLTSAPGESSGPAEIILRGIFILCLALPAILPPLAVGSWGWAMWRKKIAAQHFDSLLLLILAMVALIAAAFPRMDIMHLGLVAALPYVLAAAGLATILTLRPGAILAFSVLPLAVLFSLNSLLGWFQSKPVATPAGTVRADANVAPELQKLVSTVRPGQGLFVYPYLPIATFVTQTTAASRFCYLNPGMMTHEDELKVLSDLQAQPPEWMLFLSVSREEFLRVFPGATHRSERYETLERWLADHYQPYETPVTLGGYKLYHRGQAALSSSAPLTSSEAVLPSVARAR
jgi:4-amino-4-deoxy-L-arabinose transferase-like glycosyltransferase